MEDGSAEVLAVAGRTAPEPSDEPTPALALAPALCAEIPTATDGKIAATEISGSDSVLTSENDAPRAAAPPCGEREPSVPDSGAPAVAATAPGQENAAGDGNGNSTTAFAVPSTAVPASSHVASAPEDESINQTEDVPDTGETNGIDPSLGTAEGNDGDESNDEEFGYFTRRARRWEKKWVKVAHMLLLKWVPAEPLDTAALAQWKARQKEKAARVSNARSKRADMAPVTRAASAAFRSTRPRRTTRKKIRYDYDNDNIDDIYEGAEDDEEDEEDEEAEPSSNGVDVATGAEQEPTAALSATTVQSSPNAGSAAAGTEHSEPMTVAADQVATDQVAGNGASTVTVPNADSAAQSMDLSVDGQNDTCQHQEDTSNHLKRRREEGDSEVSNDGKQARIEEQMPSS